MAYAYVGSTTSTTNTLTYSPTAGNYLIVISATSAGGGTPTVTVTDNGSGGSGYTNRASGVAESGEYLSVVTCGSASTGATTITVAYNGGTPGSVFLAVVEYSGLSSTGFQALSTVAFQTTPGTGTNAVVSNAITATAEPAVLVGITFEYGGNGGVTAGTSPVAFTRRVNNSVIMVEDARITSTGSFTATATASHGASDNIASYVLAISEPAVASLAASPLAFAYTLEAATLAAGGSLTLAASALSFAYTLQTTTLTQASAGDNIVQQTQVSFATSNAQTSITCPAFGVGVTAGDAIALVAYLYPVCLAISSNPVVSDGTANVYNFAEFVANPNGTNVYAITFTAPPTGTSGTLSTAWAGTTDGTNTIIFFSDGEIRLGSVTNGSTTITWTTALTGSPTVNAQTHYGPGLATWYAQNSVAGTVTPKFSNTKTGVYGLYAAEITNVGTTGIYLGSVGNLQFAPGSGSNGVTSGSLSLSQNAVLFGFTFDESTLSANAATGGTGFYAQPGVWTTLGGGTFYAGIAEDASVSASTAATFKAGNGADTFITIAMAFGQNAIVLNAANVPFAYTPSTVTLAAGGALSLSIGELSFAYTLEAATIVSGAGIIAGTLSFAYAFQPNSINYSSANLEFLMAPITYFIDMAVDLVGYQLDFTPLGYQLTLQFNTLVFFSNSAYVMPNLVGLLLQEALQVLEEAGVLVPNAIGYFGTYPITAVWGPGKPAGYVTAQSIAAGQGVVPNSAITLNVNEFRTGVVFPAGGGSIA
jgi:hypothetical protein